MYVLTVERKMVFEKQNDMEYTEKKARVEFIVISIMLFLLVILSFSTLYNGIFYRLLNNANKIPLKNYLPTVIIFIPIILSIITLIIFICNLNNQIKLQQEKLDSSKKATIFQDIMKEFREPTFQRTKRIKRVLWTLSIFTLITILVSYIYIIILFLKFL